MFKTSRVARSILSFTLVFLILGTGSSLFAADIFFLDDVHCTVEFSVRHLMISNVKGQFPGVSGKILYDENDLSKSSIEVIIKVASINTNDEKRDEHLRSPDFFDAEKFPEITFKSTKIEKAGEAYLVTGALTMRNVTKEISFPFEVTGRMTDRWGTVHTGAEATLKLNRQDYGISWSKTLDDGNGLLVGDEVKIGLSVEAIKQK